ncbi:YneF family protein [Mycoplasma enhydrae]|uniref:YneF family protein n=1 Tax=Mycoplasma enhydrae TaxID=2499220 RepID=UPI00197C28A2|nr:YneF family protein [Mycoplasma enhydrae]MBN4089231.1 YneF family protein [Mycoplasma enhydrae]MCV3733609.1 YneF family protein [Mycoplasma enhydrae]MCV3753675.1 YneF family protein [Mycoplasma enhydrae]
MPTWGIVLLVILPLVFGVIGGIVAVIITKKKFEKQLRENPPINEKMIRVMFQQMGRKASEAQIRQVMRSMKNAK